TVFGKAHVFGQFSRHPVQVTHDFPITFFDVIDGGDGLFWDDQQVHRRLGVNVPKGQAEVVFIDDVRRDFPVDDFGENGFRHVRSLVVMSGPSVVVYSQFGIGKRFASSLISAGGWSSRPMAYRATRLRAKGRARAAPRPMLRAR